MAIGKAYRYLLVVKRTELFKHSLVTRAAAFIPGLGKGGESKVYLIVLGGRLVGLTVGPSFGANAAAAFIVQTGDAEKTYV